jgi:hypothetical protein
MNTITDLQEARKLAERLVSDIAFYNREKVKQALKQDTLFDVLGSEIEEARTNYISRVDIELETQHNLFNRAIVDIMIKPFDHEETTIW